MKTYKRDSRFVILSEYDSFAKDDHFMEVTDWWNGEGTDVIVQSVTGEQRFSLTWGEWEALKALLKESYEEDDPFNP